MDPVCPPAPTGSGTHPVAAFPTARPRLLGDEELAERLAIETERAARYGRDLAVLAIELGEGAHDLRAVGAAALEGLRLVDFLGTDGPNRLVAVLPETGLAADVPARRLLAIVRALAPRARAGVALHRIDVATSVSLLDSARNAAAAAPIAALHWHSDTLEPLPLGERSVVAVDTAMRAALSRVERLAGSDIPVLVVGETGVGKDVVATALHAWSRRSKQRFVAINCAALADTIFESEMFGYERGAFSGAYTAKVGLLEAAQGGTLFLDEVGELSLSAQAKLLRVLESKTMTRVGAVAERRIDVRIVGATNRDLQSEVSGGRFRQDLYFRLSAASVAVPPLRSRPHDLLPLAHMLLREACERLGRPPLTITEPAQRRLSRHSWPGNVRELRNLMELLAATEPGDTIDEQHLDGPLAGGPERPGEPRGAAPGGEGTPTSFRNIYEEIRELERTRIEQALAASGGVRVKAAALIGMPLRTLITKIKDYGLAPRDARR